MRRAMNNFVSTGFVLIVLSFGYVINLLVVILIVEGKNITRRFVCQQHHYQPKPNRLFIAL